MKQSLNRTRKALLLCTVAVLALTVGGVLTATAADQDDATSDESNGFFLHAFRWMRGLGGNMFGSLSDEQRNELSSEIKALISSKFEEWGIEPPEPLLSEEQQTELQEGIEQLRENDATPEEIREYIAGMLESWGLELPERPMNQGRFLGNGAAFQGRHGSRRGFGYCATS